MTCTDLRSLNVEIDINLTKEGGENHLFDMIRRFLGRIKKFADDWIGINYILI